MPKILLVNDNSDQNNWGAQATPYAIKEMLRDYIPGVSITTLSYSWLGRRFRQVQLPFNTIWTSELRNGHSITSLVAGAALKTVSRNHETFPEIVDDWDWFADEWLGRSTHPVAPEFLAAARAADVVIHNGENGLYKNSLTGSRSLFLLWLAKTRLGKPSCEINATAHLTTTRPVMQGMIARLFPKLDVITAREPYSARNLQALGVERVHSVPDVVFYLKDVNRDESKVREWQRASGLNGAPYFCLSAGSLPMSRPRPNAAGAVAQLVTRLKSIVPNAVLIAKDEHCLFLKDVARETGSTFFGPDHTFHELWPLLQGASFLVSGHYHYAIMGAMVGCPFIPLSTNNHKMEGACELLRWPIKTYDSTALGSCIEAIAADAARLCRERDTLAHALIEQSSRLRSEAAANATLIKDTIR